MPVETSKGLTVLVYGTPKVSVTVVRLTFDDGLGRWSEPDLREVSVQTESENKSKIEEAGRQFQDTLDSESGIEYDSVRSCFEVDDSKLLLVMSKHATILDEDL